MKNITLKNTLRSLLIICISWIGLSQNAMAQDTADSSYVKIEVDGLSCPFCAYGLEKKLKDIQGAKDIYISVKGGYTTFQIAEGEPPTKEELKKIVKDAGFTPREVSYSDQAFARDEE